LNETGLHGQPCSIGVVRSHCYIPSDLLNDGIHKVNVLIVKDEATILYSKEEVLIFDVQDKASRRGGWHGQARGCTSKIEMGEFANKPGVGKLEIWLPKDSWKFCCPI